MSKRIFLSAVTDELGSTRKYIGRLLEDAGFRVDYQETGLPIVREARVLCDQLKTLVDRCDTAIYFVGYKAGLKPQGIPAKYRKFIPEDFGIEAPSYTQWEYLFHLEPDDFNKSSKSLVFLLMPDDLDQLETDQAQFRAWICKRQHNCKWIEDRADIFYELQRTEYFHAEALKQIASQETNLPTFRSRDKFFGRKSVFHALITGWKHFIDNPESEHQHQRCLIGAPGIGKTRTAVEFAYRFREHFKYRFFVTGDKPSELRSSFAGIAKYLGVELAIGEAEQIAEVQNRLCACKDWLLIVDNLDDPELWECCDELTNKLSDGFVLTTGRDTDVLPDHAVELPEISKTEAVDYLRSRDRRKRFNDEERLSLVEAIGAHPLALQAASAFLAENRVPMSDYLMQLDADATTLGATVIEQAGIHKELYAVFQTSFQKLCREAQWLLAIFGAFSAEEIPRLFLGPELESQLKKVWDFPGDAGSASIDHAYEQLVTYSLVSELIERNTIAVHRSVALMASLQAKGREKMIRQLTADLVVNSLHRVGISGTSVHLNQPQTQILIDSYPHIFKLWSVEGTSQQVLGDLSLLHDRVTRTEQVTKVGELFDAVVSLVSSMEASPVDQVAAWLEFLKNSELIVRQSEDAHQVLLESGRSRFSLDQMSRLEAEVPASEEALPYRVQAHIKTAEVLIAQGCAKDAIAHVADAFALQGVTDTRQLLPISEKAEIDGLSIRERSLRKLSVELERNVLANRLDQILEARTLLRLMQQALEMNKQENLARNYRRAIELLPTQELK